MSTEDVRDRIAVLRALHDDLAGLVVEMSPEQLREMSYATEWTVADVLSHLGSGAEISLLRLRAGREDGPTYEETAQVWATWDALTPEQQAVEAVAADEAYIGALEALDDDTLATLHRALAGDELDAAATLGLRVSEHAIHGWDIAVAFDEDAVVPALGVPVVWQALPTTLRFAAQPHDDELRVRVTTIDPDAEHVLVLLPGEARLLEAAAYDEATGPVDGELLLPAEAFLRLVYGRLDPRHTPPHKSSDPALLDRLREIFQGI